MGPTLCTVLTVIALMFAISIGMYLNWHCPPFSNALNSWNRGDSGYFSSKGKTIFFKDVNSGKGQLKPGATGTLLLLHGFPTSSYDWVKLWPELIEQFDRVIAPDFLGLGFSDKPVGYNYTVMEQADIMEEMMRALGVQDVHIFAHDYGDTVAQELIHRQMRGGSNGRFTMKSICMLNGGIFEDTYHIRPGQKLLLNRWLAPIASQITNRFFFNHAFSEVFGPKTKPSPQDLYDFWCTQCHNSGYLNMPNILDYVRQRTYNSHRWKQALEDINIPFHFIYGPSDPVNPPPFIAYFKKTVPQATIDVLDEAVGHYPQWEDRENTLSSYLKFIRKIL